MATGPLFPEDVSIIPRVDALLLFKQEWDSLACCERDLLGSKTTEHLILGMPTKPEIRRCILHLSVVGTGKTRQDYFTCGTSLCQVSLEMDMLLGNSMLA